MGYADLYEGSTVTLGGIDGYLFRYSWQQRYGVQEAGLAPDVVSMGLPGWTADWGSGGRGSNVLSHIHECIYDCAVPASVSVWDIQLWGTSGTTNWRSSEVWEALAKLARYESIPIDNDGDDMADEWEMAYFGSTNAVDGQHWQDKDHDGYSNLEEYVAGTDPTNSLSILRVGIQGDDSGNLVVRHEAYSVDAFDVNYGDLQRYYWLEHASNLLNNTWTPVPDSTSIISSNDVISYTNAVSGDGGFNRVGTNLR
jgi:hypothetical protein